MAKILLQTTIPFAEDDWHVGRFSLLKSELERSGHEVTARDRQPGPDGSDPVLSELPDEGYDQLWLMAVDAGNGLTKKDLNGVLRFREKGGGVLTARDHGNLGACLSELGKLGLVNHFHDVNPESEEIRRAQDDRDNPHIPWPNYHSGANGDYQRIEHVEPLHEILRTSRTQDGRIAFFPAHPHEGAVDAPEHDPCARVIARGTSIQSGRTFNIAVALEGEACDGSNGVKGRAVAESTFHHFADMNWDTTIAPPSFVTDKPGTQIANDPERLEVFKEYIRNIARWLS